MSEKICVVQTKSSIGSNVKIKATLAGLGLRRIGQKSVLERTDCTLGMIAKVKHLVEVKDGQNDQAL
ncbi:MAG TPA: 50S ribosomal protein L30 [Desulfobulbaceae bacterium]|nr:50S ribosomal protein L30 [Desulfobulbaceae bacterium]